MMCTPIVDESGAGWDVCPYTGLLCDGADCDLPEKEDR